MSICQDNIFNKEDARRHSGVAVLLVPDWTTLDLTSPYYDPKTKKYYITVPTEHDVPPKEQLQQILQEAKRPGCEGLLRVYGRVVSETNIQNLVRIAQTPDWFVPERPNPKCGPEGQVIPIFGTKVLVSVDSKAIDDLPLAQLPSGPINLPLAAHEINLISSELRSKVKGASTRIAKYATDSEHLKGKININLNKESVRLENFVSVLENLLIANGEALRASQDDLIIIGLDKDNKIIYVLIDDGRQFVRMGAGFDNFLKTKPASNDRTIKYLQHLDELNEIGAKRSDVPLVDFLRDFTARTPEIKLGLEGVEANFSKTFSNVTSIKDVIKTTNKKSVKSEEDIEAEDVLLASPKLKASIAAENGSRIDFSGDAVLSVPNFDKLLEKVNSLEDVYQEVLNKVSLQSIIAMALKCFPPPDPCVLARAFLRSLKPEELLSTLAEKAGINLLTIPELDPVFRAGIRQCFDSMDAAAQADFLGIISVKANARVDNVSQLTGVPLQTIVDAFEGKNLLKKLINDNIVLDIIDAGIQGFCAKLVARTSKGDFSFDFNIDIDINLPEIPKFEIPTITLDDLLPTADIMASISVQIEAAITDALVAALVDMIKSIIKGILENCGDISDKNFGALNFNDLLAKSVNINVNTEAFLNVKTKLLGGLSSTITGIDAFANSLGKFIDDVSALLSPSEVSNLFNGSASEEVTLIIDCLVSNKYQSLKPMLDNPSKIEDTFQALGELVDKQLLLDQIAQRNEVFGGTVKEFCAPVDNDGRKKLLENKGLTPDQIDDQIAMANKRRNDRLSNLLDLANKDKVLDGIIPPVFCKGTDTKLRGMIPRDHPSFKHMLNKTVDVMYENTHISFNNEITAFPTALKETATVKVPREIPRKIKYTDPDGNEADIANPEFTRLISQGVSVDPPSKPDDDNTEDNKVLVWEDVNFATGFVAKGLKNNLENIEFDSRLYSIDNNTGQVTFNIPNNLSPNVLGSPEKTPTDAFTQLQQQLGTIQSVENRIEYILPTNPQADRDEYTLIVDQKSSLAPNNPVELFRTSKSAPIPPETLNFVRNKALNVSPNTSLPQSYFSSLVTKIWKEGASIYSNGSEISKPDYAKGISSQHNLAAIDGAFRNKIKTQIYGNIFTDLFAAMSRQAATSKMFDSKILSLVKFTPPKQPNGCQPHLLDLEAIKQKMKDDFNNSECVEDISPVVDGLGKPTLNSLEQAGVSGAVMTFVRLFTIDLVLKSIFTFSEFKLSDISEIDDVVILYYVDAIKKGISTLGVTTNDPAFTGQFNEQVLKTYNDRVAKKDLEGEKTQTLDVALGALIKEQVLSVIERISAIIGSQGDININKILVEEWLPLFDVADGNIRFATDAGAGNKANLKKSSSVLNPRKDYETLFNLENGSLVLEKYIRIDDKPPAGFDVIQLNRRGDGIFGVSSLTDVDAFIQGTVKTLEATDSRLQGKVKFDQEFQGWSYGLRLVYIPPLKATSFETLDPDGAVVVQLLNDDSLTSGLFSYDANSKIADSARLNKAFKIYEGTNARVQGGFQDFTQPMTRREINSFPLFSVEIPEANLAGFTTNDSVSGRWDSHSEQLKTMLMDSPEFNFMFQFCFPLNRMLSLLIIYNIVYLSNVKKLIPLFNGTKTSLKQVFQALLNSGNYKYDDPYISQLGGNSGGATTSNNNENTEPEVPGMSLAAIAARTPFLILKGLVELTDINIGNARKIVDTAKEHDKNIPIVLASIAQLPMNVIPPPPFGPGIGAPITPLGFLYLALDIDGIFDSAKGKDIKRDQVSADFGFNLNANIPGFCPDKGGT